MKKTDHRTRVTKLLIRKAFMDLLSRKPIQSISVKELCELAGINRGTFYAHYTDIYFLMDEIENEMLQEFQKALEPLLTEGKNKVNPIEITTQMFACLKNNSDLCTVTLGEYGDKNFLMKLIQMGRDCCLESYSKYFENVSPKKIEYFYAFASAGCIGLLQKWLCDGMSAPASEIAEAAEDIMALGFVYLQK